MAECDPSSDMKGTATVNGSGSLPEDKTSVVVISEKNKTANINDKAEETSMLNGSAPPEHKSAEPVCEQEGNENKINEEEYGKEKKHVEGNDTAKGNDIEEAKKGINVDDGSTMVESNDIEETKEDKQTEDASASKAEDVSASKAEDVKIGDAEGDKSEEDAITTVKTNDVEETKEDNKTQGMSTCKGEDVKMCDAEDDKSMEDANTVVKTNDVEDTKEDQKTEDASTSKAEDEKVSDAKGDKADDGMSTTAKANDVEESREDKEKDASTAEAMGEKITDLEGDGAVDVQDAKMVDAEDVKDEEGGEEEEKGEQGTKEGDDTEEQQNGTTERKVNDDKVVKGFKRKRTQVQKARSKAKDSATRTKELLNSPITLSIERPVRERKTVERLVEVIEKEASREFQVEKGQGTPLKDIPRVAHKLAKKKPADIKLIHQTLFGRKGKAANFKNHILQFSGFVWHESDEKQRAKMKEKLDKYVKDTLLDLCDLFDLPVVSKTNTRKEDLVEKLLDFLVAPHPITESTKSRKRKRVTKGSELKNMQDKHAKRSKKKQTTSETSHDEEGKGVPEMVDEDEDDSNNSVPHRNQMVHHSESEDEENELEQVSQEDEHEKEDQGKGKKDNKKPSKKQESVGKEKVGTSSKLGPIQTTTKSPKTSSFKGKDDDVGAKVFSRKKKIADSPKKKSIPRLSKKVEKDAGKKLSKDKAKLEAEPTKEDLRKKICEILKEVDFNTATFTDILKQLATYYKMDLTPRKPSIKLVIQEELTKLAEAEDDEDEDEETQEPAGKEVEA
ncbi:protein DEK-like [Canna indica]|uniref:Protein DEK-like n=1 Tax=Canna indica TaxID=4628 RepID=A0AAQ3JKT0_9LILI|nr:protein DEK-like [Canna indica]